MKLIQFIVEKHPDGYIAYPLGLKGVVIGQGATYEEAMADVKSAISFHVETFGPGAVEIATSEMYKGAFYAPSCEAELREQLTFPSWSLGTRGKCRVRPAHHV